MDRLIKRFDRTKDDDLCLVPHRGIAYQRDPNAGAIEYGDAYFDHYKALEGSEVAGKLNAGRCALLARHAPEGASVLDIGAGCGTFVKTARAWGFEAKGYDIIPKTVAALKEMDAYCRSPAGFDVVTFWDSLEHMEDPEVVLKDIPKGALVLAAVPVVADLAQVRESKHYKPGEHLYYFTAEGFVAWMELHGFRLIEQSDHEVQAGRESIGAFAFRKDFPDYHDHLLAYTEIHGSRYYGSSATELHLDTVAKIVKRVNPASILDFGCGRSDLVAHFWRDGERRIERYDPAIPPLRRMPAGKFDLVLCCDVMEHIPMGSVDRVLDDVRSKGSKALFTISTKLARAKLPDGRNAHVTLLTAKEWKRWIGDYFGDAEILPGKHEHDLIIFARPAP